MNGRDLALLLYAGMLGWFAQKWWRAERESIIGEAAWRAYRDVHQPVPPADPVDD